MNVFPHVYLRGCYYARKETKDISRIGEWLKAALIALLLAYFCVLSSLPLRLKGESMPNVGRWGKGHFNKFIYLVSEPARGDIVIISMPKRYVKRVIGLRMRRLK